MTPGYFTGFPTPFSTGYYPGDGAAATTPSPTPPPTAGYFTPYLTAFSTGYFPGSGAPGRPRTAYRPPAPTGWKSAGRRKGPDPDTSIATRKAGEG